MGVDDVAGWAAVGGEEGARRSGVLAGTTEAVVVASSLDSANKSEGKEPQRLGRKQKEGGVCGV